MQRERQVKGLRSGGRYCRPCSKRGCTIGVSPSEKIIARAVSQAVRALEGEEGVVLTTAGLASHVLASARYGIGINSMRTIIGE